MRKVDMDGARREELLSYRRGVLLGMTMAEIMILLLFCILMAFVLKLETFTQLEENSEVLEILQEFIVDQGGDVSETWESVHAVASIISVVGSDGLREVIEKIEDASDKPPSAVVDSLVQGADLYQKLVEQIAGEHGGAPSEEVVNEAIENVLEHQKIAQAINKLEKAAAQAGIPSEEIESFLDNKLAKAEIAEAYSNQDLADAINEKEKEIKQLETKLERLDLALDRAELQLSGKGQGLVYPSCFVDKNGSIQYIYDVYFDESRVRLESIPVDGYEEDVAVLPFYNVSTSMEVPIDQYVEETEPLFLWSQKNKCRFFVKIYDQTAAQNKDRYKFMKRRIEYSFYTREISGSNL